MQAEVVCLSTSPTSHVSPPNFGPASPAGSSSSLCPQLLAMSGLHADMSADELVSPGASPRGMLKQRAESDAASTFAESFASEGATSDEEDDQPSLLRHVAADQLVTV